MQVVKTDLEGVLLFEPTPHRDARGFFSRTSDDAVLPAAGIHPTFPQDSQSRSVRGVVRGMHGRLGRGEAKLVRCAHGAVFDVVVDTRPGSPTFGRCASFTLDDESMRSVYIPRGFLHGFQALTDVADTCYRIDAVHDPSEDVSVAFSDPDLDIPWPLPPAMVSERDRNAPSWREFCGRPPPDGADRPGDRLPRACRVASATAPTHGPGSCRADRGRTRTRAVGRGRPA